MPEVFANYPVTTISSGGTTAPSSGTVETWTGASWASFAAASSTATPPTWFYLADPALPAESVLVTNISGTSATVTRGALGSTPVAHTGGFTVKQVASAGTLANFQAAYQAQPDWINAVTEFGADPTNTTDSTAAITNLLDQCSPGQLGFLPWGKYKVSEAIPVPSYTGLVSTGRTMGSPYDWGTFTPYGAMLVPASGFSGTGVLELVNTGSNVLGGQVLRNIAIAAAAQFGSFSGIYASGNIFAATIEDVYIQNMSAYGLEQVDGGGSVGPDDWYVRGLKVSHCATGVSALSPDTWWVDCEVSECTGTNWAITGCGNSRWANCKGENSSGGYGWYITTGATGPLLFDNCTSQINYLSGWKITGPDNAQGNALVKLTNCGSDADASIEGTGSAGLLVTACSARVVAVNWHTLLTDGGAYPPYGAILEDSSFGLTLTSSFLQGSLGATYDDGSNTHVLVNNLPVT